MRNRWKWVAGVLALALLLALAFSALLVYGILDFGLTLL